MDFTQFQGAVLALQVLPEAESQRALTVGRVIGNEDRLELLRYLQEIAAGIEESFAAEEAFLAAAEGGVAQAERRLVKAERGGAEEAQREEEMEGVEEKFSQLTHGSF